MSAPAGAAAKGVSAGCPDHTVTLTTLTHLLRTLTEDEALCWLAEQLLLTPEQHQQRVHFCLDLQVSTGECPGGLALGRVWTSLRAGLGRGCHWRPGWVAIPADQDRGDMCVCLGGARRVPDRLQCSASGSRWCDHHF